jgi:mxaJ protein
MCSAFRKLSVFVGSLVLLALLIATPLHARELRVCADPNNLPFSNVARDGFENRIVALLAAELDATLTYTWWAQRRGFIRNTLKAGLCDLVPGVAAGMEMLVTTAPYYRSAYVFVTRPDGPVLASIDDEALRTLKIGVQMIGDDGANTPPAHALARRGIADNVRGFMVYGDYREPNPTAAIIAAVARREIDVAIAWGPLAGYFAPRQDVPLHITPVAPARDLTLPLAFDIAMGVRHGDEALRAEIDAALSRRHDDILAILKSHGVPLVRDPRDAATAKP